MSEYCEHGCMPMDHGAAVELNNTEVVLGYWLDDKGMKHCPQHGLVGAGWCISCDGGVF